MPPPISTTARVLRPRIRARIRIFIPPASLRWHYQEVPDDLWDFDSSYEVILMDREVRGRMRQLLVHMNKSGLTFVLDRATGEFVGVFSAPEVRNWISGV